MNIGQDMKRIILVATLLVPGIVQAEVIEVGYPYLEVQDDSGLTGALLTTSGPTTTLELEGIVLDIIKFSGDAIDDIDPNEIFSLTATSSDFDGLSGTFAGSFTVSGGLLSGSFDSMNVGVTDVFFDTYGSFETMFTYTGGSLQGSLVEGGLVGGWYGDAAAAGGADLTATKIHVVPVPAAVWLFGSGLLGLVGLARRKAS